jgi:hypothetical protein
LELVQHWPLPRWSPLPRPRDRRNTNWGHIKYKP